MFKQGSCSSAFDSSWCACSWAAAVAAAAAGALAAHTLARQFEYVYTPERQAADLKRIPNFVPDK